MEYKTYSRKDLLEEVLLRENIRKVLGTVLEERRQKEQKTWYLRELIKDLLLEADTEVAPHESTGINVLEDLLKKIVPQVEQDFKTLTTSKEQRDSFRAHILNATENSIAPMSALRDEGEGEGELEDLDALQEADPNDAHEVASDLPTPSTGDQYGRGEYPFGRPPATPQGNFELEEDIEVSVGASDGEEERDIGDIASLDDDEKMIDIGNVGGPQSDDESFEGLAGQDDTGRNIANMSFKKIEKSIVDSYQLLGDTKDQDLFRDYLLTNLKLYFDKFEDELGAGAETEPTNDEYQKEKEKAPETEEPGAEEPEGGEEGEEEGEEGELELEL